ncbi:MAG TPA: serine/threonine-protein kinase, partial [Pyrinomonadaceae bacterium]|nr:serine/threonine-protein kinase [Pyrinomonadaceae bacterium]
VAVKIIRAGLSQSKEFVARFHREAEAAGRLRHPNVVDVTDFGLADTEQGQTAYLVMEYLDGCTLAEVLAEERRLPISWVVDILEQVCSAVEEAHQLGIVHRDLKPENIWLEPNRRGGYTVKVLDFGLVKMTTESSTDPAQDENVPKNDALNYETRTLLRAETNPESDTILRPVSPASSVASSGSRVSSNGRLRKHISTAAQNPIETKPSDYLTRVGSLMGTPPYMSPEQCRGDQLDARSDIYSLGVIAYRMMAGIAPFSGTVEEIIHQHRSATPPPLRAANRKISRRMARTVMGALEKDPAQRPQTAAGFSSSLRAGHESVSQLLRQAIALYSEHFPTFLKLSLIGYAPLGVVLVIVILLDKWSPFANYGLAPQIFVALIVFVTTIAFNVLAYFFVSAATVPVVIQIMTAPLRPVRIRSALLMLKECWVALTGVALLVLAMILGGTLFLIIPGILAAVYYSLYAPVLMIEGTGVRATLRRTRRLVTRERLSALVITVVQFALPLLVWRAAVTTHLVLRFNDNWSPKEFSFNFSMSSGSVPYQFLNIFVTPLTAIMISLLYLKTRRAGGESLKDVAAGLEMFDLPNSKWQKQMKSRSSSLKSRSE